MKDIILILIGLAGGLLVWFFKSIISLQIKNKLNSQKETFDIKKLGAGLFSVVRPDLWGKSLNQELSIRTWLLRLTILGIIFSVAMGYGFWKGQQGKAIKVDIGYGKEARIDINGEYLYIDKEGNVYLKDTKTDKTIKQISVKDIPGLKKKLAPYGFELEPIALIGLGLGDEGLEGEGGVGLSWLRYFKYRLQAGITNAGIYPLAVGYRITDNSGLTIGVGKGWKGDERVTLFYHFKF